MKHARPDYDRIQDPSTLIPDDEPVFLIRGQDKAGPCAVEAWALEAMSFGASREIIKAARAQAERMRDWQRDHASKVPDMPLEATP